MLTGNRQTVRTEFVVEDGPMPLVTTETAGGLGPAVPVPATGMEQLHELGMVLELGRNRRIVASAPLVEGGVGTEVLPQG
jgi:hypothetical protein